MNIAFRTNRLLNFFLLALLLILFRVWYLGVVQYGKHYEESLKPKRRTMVDRVERGTIRDRFNLPLAINKIQYNAAICYADIRQIPSIQWKKKEGKTRRVLARKEYIEKLSCFLGEALDMDPQKIEDTIHGKASLFPHTPFVLKEDIPENLYYQLKMCEKDWLGIEMQRGSQRIYPHGKLACDVIGYMGAIGPREYLKIAQEMQELKTYIADQEEGKAVFLPVGFSSTEEVRTRLRELDMRAYTIHDQIGKSGVEASFDELLRGTYGKNIFEVDIKGNLLKKLSSSQQAHSGERLILSLSAELQLEAEKLLSEYEVLQEARDQAKGKERKVPWQRGGAIVVMDPKTGEVLALASTPRFDPNDFVPAQSFEKRRERRDCILKWLENESHIADIWDGKLPMQRELYSSQEKSFYIEELPLTWENYLDCILTKEAPLRLYMDSLDTLEKAIAYQENPFEIGDLSSKEETLLLDLLRLVVKKEDFPSSLRSQIENLSLSQHRTFCQSITRYLEDLKECMRHYFQNHHFKQWREKNLKEFIREKRKEERVKKTFARPYTEYLEKEEQRMFSEFWEANKMRCIHAFVTREKYLPEILSLREEIEDPLLDSLRELLTPLPKKEQLAYLQTLHPFQELHSPLFGTYPTLRRADGIQYEKHLAAAFYPYSGFGYGRSQAFRQASPLGSIFKLVPAYAALKQQQELDVFDLNPLTLIDDMQKPTRSNSPQVLGFFEDGTPIHRLYKGGRLPRGYPRVGKLDLPKAIERSSNLYFSILASDVLESSRSLLQAATSLGIGSKTGIDLPGEYAGAVPDDLMHNKTGLYSFAIGQHSLVATPLQTAVMLSAIANGGKVLKPQIVKLSAGASEEKGYICFRKPQVKETLPFTPEMHSILLDGMHRVINGPHGTARLSLMQPQFHDPTAIKSYRKLHTEMVGKTGTAEILYKPTMDGNAQMEKHVWFGGISFHDEEKEDPELVVVVYLRFGSAGRQGAPIAARLVEKWREINFLH